MKKYCLVLFVFFFSAANAQFLNHYGIKIGGNFTHQNWDYSIDYANFQPDDALGFSAGIFAEFLNIKNFSVLTELNYTRNSISKELPVTTINMPDGDGTTTNWKLNIDYIEFAVLAKAKINFILLSPYIFAGPSFKYEISKSLTENTSGFYNDFKKSQPGIKIGLGSEIHLAVISLLAEFSYNKNFNDLYKNENLEITSYYYDFRIGVMF